MVGCRKLIMKKWYPWFSAGWVQSGMPQDFGIHGFSKNESEVGHRRGSCEKGTKWEKINWGLFFFKRVYGAQRGKNRGFHFVKKSLQCPTSAADDG